MRRLYSFLTSVVERSLPVTGVFSDKMRLFVRGRTAVFSTLMKDLEDRKPVIWFHAASLGEYEQGLPVMESVAQQYPKHQLLLTFFSPSGYEVKKNSAFANLPDRQAGAVTYLPLDTPSNARDFLDIVQPEMVFFIKYEFWPNYLKELKSRKIRTFLISGVFRENQAFFKPFGKWMTQYLDAFEHFFLQDNASAEALQSLGFSNFIISGDTRFDRVSHQIEVDNTLDFATAFCEDQLCVVCGSTWKEDDDIIVPFINQNKGTAKFIIAPHEINSDKISLLQKRLQVKTVLYSEMDINTVASYDVLIIDTIGLLTRLYSYATVAYVGGAMGTTGLHNILEPATFGMPIITGSNLEKFPEAKRLQQLAGLFTVKDASELSTILKKLLMDKNFRTQSGMISGHYVNSNTGATRKVLEYLEK
ncbi:3-deoxy-D-manno-octulosonic acid transferase [Dokdonia sinensis]|uniref:3-deoxy-D-manno-octulosonic acid transferase n=1 Tax=Dokdonia sinensis TaxID=2479847 RepID=A0A3M0G2I5_9FLAO|nr:glycosyltransferase N-terminal domain-containing protein [Dokdonia sinensis]RMB56113.1 3-deoxy-D-manno-octulosonic acid transferase [Dokdonia sinensis]